MSESDSNIYMQFGCGFSAPTGWLNFDASPTLRFERLPLIGMLYTRNSQRFPAGVRYGDIVRGLPLSNESCKGIYCSHVLEHLAYDDFRTALKNIWVYLQPGGVFRLVVPDLERLARDYLANQNSEAAKQFMEGACLGVKTRSHGLTAFLKAGLGNSAHLWMWDEKAMKEQLRQHGFNKIRRAQYGDAEDGRFNEVEDAGRFEGCLAMQCCK